MSACKISNLPHINILSKKQQRQPRREDGRKQAQFPGPKTARETRHAKPCYICWFSSAGKPLEKGSALRRVGFGLAFDSNLYCYMFICNKYTIYNVIRPPCPLPVAPLLPCNCPITSLKMPKALATPPNLIAHTAAQDIIKNNILCQNLAHIPIQPLNHHLVPLPAKVCSVALAEFLWGGPPVASRRDGAMTTSASKYENMLRY